jgi:hypothetical protein
MALPEEAVVSVLIKSARHCCICRRFLPLQIQVHHIIEKSDGGIDDESNLIPICIYCHSTVHTKTHMTRGFTIDELKGHRDMVYDMVNKGKLPAQPSLTGGELQAMAALIVNSQKNITSLSNDSIKILLATACEDSKIQVQLIARLNNKLEFQEYCNDDANVIIGMQSFILPLSTDKQTPLAIIELEQNGFIKIENDFASITKKGLVFVHDIVKTTSKYIEKKVICKSCNLHFSIYSWYADAHYANTLHCPECGQSDGHFSVYSQRNFGFIFEKVPGHASSWDSG